MASINEPLRHQGEFNTSAWTDQTTDMIFRRLSANLEGDDTEREGLCQAAAVDRRCATAPPINSNSAIASAMKVTIFPER
jgi:hypothetical protein